MDSHSLQCAEIWGGIEEGDAIIASPGLIASLYSSSGEGTKGGDIHYLSMCNSTYITRVAIADVVGHGEVVSEISHHLYRALGKHVDSLNSDDIVSDLNKVAINQGIKAITTAIVLSYYREDKTLSYVYAGHPPMLLKKYDQNRWEPVDLPPAAANNNSNIPLAVDEEASYTQQSITLNSGDRILLYTDGLLETISEQGKAFGMPKLQLVLESGHESDLEALRDGITGALCQHAGGKLNHDDVTLILLEIR